MLTMTLCGLQLRQTPTPSELDGLAPELPSFSFLDAVQVVQTVALVVDRLYHRYDGSVTRNRDLLETILRLSNWLYLGGVGLRVAASLVAEHNYEISRTLYHAFGFVLSIYSTCMCLAVLKLLARISRPFGVLLIAIDQMLQEVSMYVALSLLLFFSFSFGFFGLERVGDYTPPDTGFTANRHQWYMLPAFAYIAPPFSGIPEDSFHGAAALFMLLYLFFTTKVLTSLIMAIFATAHTRVFKNAEIEYVYESHYALFEYRHVLLRMPPPFNLLYILYTLVAVACTRLSCIVAVSCTRLLASGKSFVKSLLDSLLNGQQAASAEPYESNGGHCKGGHGKGGLGRSCKSVHDLGAARGARKSYVAKPHDAENSVAPGMPAGQTGKEAHDSHARYSVTAFVEGFLKAEEDKETSAGSLKALHRELKEMKQQHSELRADLAARFDGIERWMERLAPTIAPEWQSQSELPPNLRPSKASSRGSAW